MKLYNKFFPPPEKRFEVKSFLYYLLNIYYKMKQKIILSIVILSLLSLAVFVSAKMTFLYEDDGVINIYNTEVRLLKGWNLVAGFEDNVIDSNSEIKLEDIKAMWFYNPSEKEYIRSIPHNEEFQDLILMDICGDNKCSLNERDDYSSWCAQDCWSDLSKDILNNIKITNQKEFTVGLNKQKEVNLGVFDFEFYLEKGPDYLDEGVRLQTKISDRHDFSNMDYYKRPHMSDYKRARLIEGNSFFFGNPKAPNTLFALIEEPTNGNYKIIWYEIPSKLFMSARDEQIPSMQEKIMSQPAWVYSNKDGILKFEYPVLILSEIELERGWNFMTMTPEMVGKTIMELKGTCTIEKAFGWEPDSQSWNDLLDERLPEEATGVGFVIKVSNICRLGTTASSNDIPELPQ